MPLKKFHRTSFPTLVLLSLGCPALLHAHDMSALAILQPASGCNLSSAESIRVRYINHGSTLPGGSIFDVSYAINGGPPVVETIFIGNAQQPNARFNYTFVTGADLSAQGTYSIVASITVSGDSNPENNASAPRLVDNWSPSVAGTLTGPTGAVTAGTLSLAGQTGAAVEWQQSSDGLRWRALENTGTSQAFSGIDSPTGFRVLVQNGACAPVLSPAIRVTPDDIFANGFEP